MTTCLGLARNSLLIETVMKFLLLLKLLTTIYSYSLAIEIVPTDKEEVGFKDLDVAILVGSMPRREGMERKDLLKANVAIFKSQGAALNQYAKKTVKVITQAQIYANTTSKAKSTVLSN